MPMSPSPRLTLPAGAVDCHVHVFGPQQCFPFAPERKYTPPDAPREALAAVHAQLGIERVVVVQATCHGTDNRAMLDALATWGERARGVAVVAPGAPLAALQALHEGGVRGLRFVMLPRLVDAPDWPALQALAARVAPLGWHIELYIEPQQVRPWWAELMALPTPIVIDHMGRPDVALGVDHPANAPVLQLLAAREDAWVKVSCPERLSVSGPWARGDEAAPYRDVLPFARQLLARCPHRVLWGSDWPHPNMHSHTPDDARLVDWIADIAPDEGLRRQLLVDNPQRLYWGL
jgi:2-pyrone-4,6-dicarboxylate lactonase